MGDRSTIKPFLFTLSESGGEFLMKSLPRKRLPRCFQEIVMWSAKLSVPSPWAHGLGEEAEGDSYLLRVYCAGYSISSTARGGGGNGKCGRGCWKCHSCSGLKGFLASLYLYILHSFGKSTPVMN